MQDALASDPSLRERFFTETHLGIDDLLYIHYPVVGSYCSFVIDIGSLDCDGFFILAHIMGLFARTGTRYQMDIPQSITP